MGMKDVVEEQNAQMVLNEDHAEVASRAATSEQSKLRQLWREVKCAINLRQRIEPYVNGTETAEQFNEGCKKEAEKIGKGAYGATFLTTMGNAMQLEAEEYLGFQSSFLGIEGHVARTKKKMSSINNNATILGAGFRAARAGRKAYRDVENTQINTQAHIKNGEAAQVSEAQKEEDEAAQAM